MFTKLIETVRAIRRATGTNFAVNLMPSVDGAQPTPPRFIDRAEPPEQLMYGGWQPWDGTGQVSWDD